ncbi:MAG: SPOR domain-containing protein [Candidatus Aminicenantes bacterium]|nr:SPOR domain-containing protein [Candidatus Aminicenantes bacterium]
MKNREFREIQVSSTQLAIIFLGILLIGVVIFLLGVSVGKKHVQAAEKANIIARQEAEPLKEKITMLPEMKPEQAPAGEPSGRAAAVKSESTPAKKEILPLQSRPEPLKTETKAAEKSSPPKPAVEKNLYYVQVAALAEEPAAQTTARRFRGMGYPVVVMDPQPTDRVPVFRVRVGGYPTREQAEEVRGKLSAAAGRKTDYFIVRD